MAMLVMLLITLPPQRHAVKLDTPLPCPTCETPEALPDPIRIAIDFDGRIKWNGVEVSRENLRQHFAEESRRAIQPEIHIEPHRLANYGVVAHVMAAAQREGLKKMGVVGGT